MNKTIYITSIVILTVLNLLLFSCNQSSSETSTSDNTTTSEKTANLAEGDGNTIETELAENIDEEAANETEANKAEASEAEALKSEANSKKSETEAKGDKPTEMSVIEKEPTPKKATTKSKKSNNTASSPPKAKKPAPPKEYAGIKFDTKEQKFGTIVMGEKVERSFDFTNTGSIPLIISDASSTCGCTIPEIPTHPIAPGDRGSIKVVFDSTGKIGTQSKEVTVMSNARPSVVKIALSGLVITKNLAPKKSVEPTKPVPPPGFKKPETITPETILPDSTKTKEN